MFSKQFEEAYEFIYRHSNPIAQKEARKHWEDLLKYHKDRNELGLAKYSEQMLAVIDRIDKTL